VSDSARILAWLEERFPEPPLHAWAHRVDAHPRS